MKVFDIGFTSSQLLKALFFSSSRIYFMQYRSKLKGKILDSWALLSSTFVECLRRREESGKV